MYYVEQSRRHTSGDRDNGCERDGATALKWEGGGCWNEKEDCSVHVVLYKRRVASYLLRQSCDVPQCVRSGVFSERPDSKRKMTENGAQFKMYSFKILPFETFILEF